MSPAAQITCSFCLTFGVPAVLAARELLALRRRDGGSWRNPPEPPPPPQNKPLPDCLIPKRLPAREVRDLELV